MVLNPASIFGVSFNIAGYLGEPLLILSISMLTVGLYGSWLKYHKPTTLVAVGIGILYILDGIMR